MPSPMPSEAVVNAWIRLVRVSQEVLSAVERDLKRAGHPPLAWYDVLLELRRSGEAGLRPFELESRLLLAQHNVSRLLERLEQKQLIARRPADDDGRGQVVTATDAGLALLKAMWPDYAAAIETHVGSRLLDNDEAQVLHRLLGKLLPQGS